MANDSYKIQAADMSGHLVAELPNTPEMDAQTLKEKFDDLAKNVIVPAFNTLANDFSTKQYVDDTVIAIGSGDMTKSVYDTDDNGKVDTAEVAEAVTIGSDDVDGDKVLYVPNGIGVVVTETLDSANWAGASAPYTQEVTVSGAKTTDIVFIEPNYLTTNTNAQNLAIRNAWMSVEYADVTAAGKITFYCYESKPTTSFDVNITIVR